MFRVFTLALLLAFSLPSPVWPEDSSQVRGIRTFLYSGKPDLAVKSATQLLRQNNLARNDRKALLSIIAEAEVQQATFSHFTDIKAALAAIDSLLREFPEYEDAADVRWRRAWLMWQAGHLNQAILAGRDITTIDQQPQNLRRAWLMMARIHLALENYSYARSDLLQYGLQVDHNSEEQAVGQAWMAIIDRGEKRDEVAFKSLSKVYRQWPQVIEGNDELFGNYIQLQRMFQGNADTIFQLSEQFIRLYVNTQEAPPVRLIHADILAEKPESTDEAIREYAILSQTYAETLVGRQAFIRKLMLENRSAHDKESLLPTMVSLKKIADTNQLSVIEDEALLNLARLWTRIDTATDLSSNSAEPQSPALQAYARAATSKDKIIARAANSEGSAWMSITLEALLKKEQWLHAVTFWRQYPQLQPGEASSQELRLGIAHALRSLMLFTASEEMLNDLYKSNRASIRGQRIMLELANLWHDRQDKDGVDKIMAWLNQNEFTIYRPEMLVIVARIQLTQQRAESARQTLKTIHPADISIESRANYWQVSAQVYDALKQWHSASSAWQEYRQSKGADPVQGLLNQAFSLFNGREYALALKRYNEVPESSRDNAWEYHTGICEMRSGQLSQGLDRLQKLVDSGQPGTWTALAKAAIADHQANTLLGL